MLDEMNPGLEKLAERELKEGDFGLELKEYKAKVEQWKREGYEVDELEEMLK